MPQFKYVNGWLKKVIKYSKIMLVSSSINIFSCQLNIEHLKKHIHWSKEITGGLKPPEI